MISTQVKNRVIVFHDKTAKYISEKEEAFIFSNKVSEKGLARLTDGEVVNLKNIAKILSSDEYSRLYPNMTTEKYKRFTAEQWTPSKETGKAMEQMLIGLKRYIDTHETTGKAEEAYRVFSLGGELKIARA